MLFQNYQIKMANLCTDATSHNESLVLENLSDMEWNIAGKEQLLNKSYFRVR